MAPVLLLLVCCLSVGPSSVLQGAACQTARSLSSYTFSGFSDAPPAAGSSAISVKASTDGKAVSVDVTAGKATAKASFAANSIKQ